MKKIPLTRGMVALVDDADYEWLSQWKWCAQSTGKGRFYAGRRASRPSRIVLMHREILQASNDVEVDHRNRDSLDNQRSNLRFATSSQNGSKKGLQRNKKLSRFKGVAFVIYLNKTNPWLTFINQHRKRTYLGYHATEEAAAEAYNTVAAEKFGEFACLNIV